MAMDYSLYCKFFMGSENGEKSSEHMQAGRTMDTFPNNSDSLTHASFTSTTALKTPEEPAASTTSLILTNQEDAPPEHFNAQDTTITTDIKSSGALVKAILSEFQNPYSNEPILEGNYMPMSPKKSVLQFNGNDVTAIFNEPEENHYVEMTRAIDSALMESSIEPSDQQQYEMVCFREGNMEPVYMEVPGGKNKDKVTIFEELPDILNNPAIKDNKSDSSDADDEASKDLESLDNPSQPRFSLSDSFRPASYYLGVSKTLPEFQDSSDSELVSPPPIPASSPPLDDEDYIPNICSKSNDPTVLLHRNSDQFFNNIQTGRTTSKEDKSSFLSLRDIDCNVSLSRLSSNSGSITSLTANSRRPVSEDFSTPTEYGKIENIHSVEDYFEGLKLSEDAMSEKDTNIEHGHAYENFLITKRTVITKSDSIPIKKRLPSPSSMIIDDYRPRCRPESSCSISGEISSFFANSNRSTPIANTINGDLHQSAPYYYSDLSNLESSLTLNNQRESINGNKKDITRIVNPLKLDETEGDTPNILAAKARSASADFLNFTDKSGNIDQKNIYESDTLKRKKMELDFLDPESKNFYHLRKPFKFQQELCTNDKLVRKSYSLEGLLENVLNESSLTEAPTRGPPNVASEGSYLWEEDSVWREQLRSVSQRHTKSMDDLDSLDADQEASIQKKAPRAITREVTYVNDILFKANNDSLGKKSGKTEVKKKSSFLIDRETLRQWDLMSSAPSDDQLIKVVDTQGTQVHVVVDSGEGSTDTGESNGHVQETGIVFVLFLFHSQLSLITLFCLYKIQCTIYLLVYITKTYSATVSSITFL